MLLDDVTITVRAGHGGAGRVSFDGHGPDGGDGGRGGSVLVRVTSDLKALNQFSAITKVVAPDGGPGRKRHSHGKNGRDVVLTLPLGTTLTDMDTGKALDLASLDQEALLCRGGHGGFGNLQSKHVGGVARDSAQPGQSGEFKTFRVVLKFIADYGLVGLPNAGKSSLLNVLTNARAAVGAYPFTTLEAGLGAFGSKIIADIPGLIAGASRGRGLGINFLKHIEKVKMLLHCISVESPDIIGDFRTINRELEKYNPALLTKNRIIILTKTDLVNDLSQKDHLAKLLTLGYPVLPVSIYNSASVENLKLTLAESE